MEACYASSSSFTKRINVVPSMNSKLFDTYNSKKSSNLFNNYSKISGVSFSITCCQAGSSSPSPKDDNTNPTNLTGDWRSFRARLVAQERAPSTVDLDPVQDQRPRFTLSDKWAHPIYEPEKGCLLVATEKLNGVHIFEKTVILLLSTVPLGPIGVILNRPSLMSIKEAQSTVMDRAGIFTGRPLYFGGPIEGGLFLVNGSGWAESEQLEEVMEGVYYGTGERVGSIGEMVKRKEVEEERVLFFEGCCGWEKEQLKEEIRAGYWALGACSPSVIGPGRVGCDGLWEEVVGLMGLRKVW